MSLRKSLAAGALGFLCVIGPAAADDPSAMVEDITSIRDDVQLMDYLTPGQEITLSGDETIVIGYFASCLQETVTGGTVTVGEYESSVDGGTVATERGFDCDDQVITYTLAQQQEAGTTALRAGTPCDQIVPDIVIYDTSPLIRLSDGGSAIAYRDLCAEAGQEMQTLDAEQGIVDFRAQGLSLTPEHLYLLQSGDREVLVLISALAEPDTPSLLARYVPL
ncbi:MAG: hypothetical protein RIM33_10050 [Alphaproteobacteria bacterium]